MGWLRIKNAIVLTVLVGVALGRLPYAQKAWADGCPPSVREVVSALRSFGATLADRRELLFPSWDVASVAARARAGGLSTLVALPELRTEMLWMIQSLLEREAELLADLGLRKRMSTAGRERRSTAIQRRFELARTRLHAWLRSPTLILEEWNAFGEEFALLNAPDYLSTQALRRKSPVFRQGPGWARGYRLVATARALSIPEMNRWLSEGLAPIRSTRRIEYWDGRTPEVHGPENTEPIANYHHDLTHAAFLPPYSPRLRQMYSHLQGLRSRSGLSDYEWELVEVVWFYATHERGTRDGVDVLQHFQRHISDTSAIWELSRRFRSPNYIGAGLARLPSDAEIRRAHMLLANPHLFDGISTP